MNRGDLYWARLGGDAGTRPVVVVSRQKTIGVRSNVIVIHVTSRIRDIPSEVPLGREEGLEHRSVAKCDDISTIPVDALIGRIGTLGRQKIYELNAGLRFALGL